MEGEIHDILANLWFAIVALVLILYIVLDGFDLGVGILTLFTGNERRRTVMMSSLGGVWDANETWLVVLAGAVFGAFPTVYATVLHALYLPVMAMLFGLILRGAALELRSQARNKTPWSLAFGIGSLLAAAAQGLALGALLGGIPVVEGVFEGNAWHWFNPYSVLWACGVLAAYALFGATYLVIKTEGRIQRFSVRLAQASAAVLVFVALIVIPLTPGLHPHVVRRWVEIPGVFHLACLLALAFYMLLSALRRGRELSPFFWSVIIFLSAAGIMVLSHYPYVIPAAVTIREAAASSKTLIFMLVGIGMLIPVMLIYNGYQYLVFRGKVRMGQHKVEEQA